MPTPAWLCAPKHAESLSSAIAFFLSHHHGVCQCSRFLRDL